MYTVPSLSLFPLKHYWLHIFHFFFYCWRKLLQVTLKGGYICIMQNTSHVSADSPIGLWRHHWKFKCCKKWTFLGKTVLKLLAIMSAHLIIIFNYSWILTYLVLSKYGLLQVIYLTIKNKTKQWADLSHFFIKSHSKLEFITETSSMKICK